MSTLPPRPVGPLSPSLGLPQAMSDPGPPGHAVLPCPPLCDPHLFPLVPQGLFRLAAGASVLKRLKQTMASDPHSLQEFCSDPHAVAGAWSKEPWVGGLLPVSLPHSCLQ